ncbi:MAG: NUDIX hydrolase [Spirulina sp. SIO3F2]|nr:NUDIX hydrolase [Spirulina sp. SIO3F2]
MSKNDKPKGEKLGWCLLNSEKSYQSPWFDLRHDKLILPNGQDIVYTYVEHPGSVFVIPLTSDREICLIRSYRYTVDDWCWEVPAGCLGDQIGSSPEEVAHQELREEIGGITTQLESLGWYYMANGFARLKNHFFIAYDVRLNEPTQHESMEIIDRICFVSIEDALEMICTGEVNDGESAFALLLAIKTLKRKF